MSFMQMVTSAESAGSTFLAQTGADETGGGSGE